MSQELVMDMSKEIFTLDKDILVFKINSSNLSKLSSHSSLHSNDSQPLSEENVTVTNLTSDYLAVRTKTTKKDKYAVNPLYCVIPPKSTKVLNFIYYNKIGEKNDPKGHKFKFEGFIIQENQKDEDIKKLFHDYIKNGTKVVGNAHKRYVRFSEENDGDGILRSSNNSLGSSNLSNYTVADDKRSTLLMDKIKEKEEENLRLSDIIEGKKEEKSGLDNANLEKLESLKKEYNQLKEQVENLKRTEESLNKAIFYEKNKKIGGNGSDKFKFNVPDDKVEKISRKSLIRIFLFAILVGFYLVK